jgi:hypothetical protein
MDLTVDSELGKQLLEELRHINRRLQSLETYVPRKDVVWLTPAEMSKITGVSPRTLQNYVATGKLSPASFKKDQRGRSFHYRYHRELALCDLGMTGS